MWLSKLNKSLNMIRIEIILSLIYIYSLVRSSEDLSENVSINTGESATFICDLPERLSNKQVSQNVSSSHLSVLFERETTKERMTDQRRSLNIFSSGKMLFIINSRLNSLDPTDVYWQRAAAAKIEVDLFSNTRTWESLFCYERKKIASKSIDQQRRFDVERNVYII